MTQQRITFLASGETRTALAAGVRIELFQVLGGGFTTVAVRSTLGGPGPVTLLSRTLTSELPQHRYFAELCETYHAEVQS